MDIVIAVLSWVVTIVLPLLVLSAPVDLIVGKLKKDWVGSKEQSVYKKVQLVTLGVWALCLMIVIVLMLV